MKKKKRVEIKINFSKRWLYTFIVIGILAIVGIGVWAYTGNVGHTSSQIDEADPTVLASVKDGVSWSELSGIPSGFADGVDDTGGASSCSASLTNCEDYEIPCGYPYYLNCPSSRPVVTGIRATRYCYSDARITELRCCAISISCS